ncbi:PAS domain S-box protein [Methanomethylovorans sp.]|uniref:PAS domain S-box protein n=1 Tax=Methanomethylovorans sp. TaxID=2758717 RepID=UPI00351C1229
MVSNELSIKVKLILYIVVGVFLVLAVSTGVIITTVTTQQEKLAYQQSIELARDYANQFDGDMRQSKAIAQTLANSMEVYSSANRDEVNNMLRNLLLKNPTLTGVYVGYEPYAFDGKDTEYADTYGHDETGRFVPYWNNINGTAALEPLVYYDEYDYYQLTKKLTMDVVTEPYYYQGIFMVSFDSPIIKDGKFVGIGGVDVSLKYIDDVVGNVKAFDTGYAFVTGNTGILVSHPVHKDWIASKTLYDFDIPEISEAADNIREGKGGNFETVDPATGKDVIMFYEPVKTGNYSFILVVPKEEMLAGVAALRTRLIIISAISIVFMGVVAYLIAMSITKPIDNIVSSFKMISQDAVQGKLDARANTDVGIDFKEIPKGLNEILDAVTAPIRENMRVTNALAKGELKTRIKLNLKGEFKQAGDTLDNFAQYLDSIVDDSNNVLTAIQNNDFSRPVRVQGEGDLRILTNGIEQTRLSLDEATTERIKAEKALRESEKKFRTLFDSTNDAIYLHDMAGNILEVNQVACERMGYSRDEFLKMKQMDIDETLAIKSLFNRIKELLELKNNIFETVHVTKSGKQLPVELSSRIIQYERKNAVLTIARDITERKRIEQALKDYAEQLEHSNQLKEEMERVVNNSPVIVFKWKPEKDWPVSFVSENVSQLGYSVEDFTSGRIKYLDILYPGDIERFHPMHEEYKNVHSDQFNQEYRIFTKSKDIRWVDERTFIQKEPSGKIILQGIILDITERKKAQETLLRAEEIRKKEIHHRVKNNLQVISSLLFLEAENFKDKEIVEAFLDSRNRVRSMALIHEELYQSGDMYTIDFADYTRNLLNFLSKSYVMESKAIELNSKIENVYLGMDTAIPLGMIINELVSNSLKHGYPDSVEGNVNVILELDGNEFTLKISDDGIGFPENLDFRQTASLGLQLVTTLVDQINGTIELERNRGTSFDIRFKELKCKVRV